MYNAYNQDNFNSFQTLQDARKDLIGEIEAVMQYDDHVQTSTNNAARQTWINIRDEELMHVGELLALLNYLNPEQKKFVEQGVNEFNERLRR
ncbi:MAG: ferritin-like domain-containing protein [Candidatus Caccovivens sp.]